MSTIIQKANDYLHSVDGKYMDVVTHYYLRFIKKETEEKIIIELIKNLVNWDFQTDMSEKIEIKYSEEDYEKMVDSIMPTVDKAIDRLIDKNVEEDSFYSLMWKHINDGLVYGEDEGKLSAFLAFCANPKVPYFKLDGVPEISEEDFRNMSLETIQKIKKFIFVYYVDFKKRTDQAYHILNLIEDCQDEKQKTVFLANIILFYEMHIKQLKDALSETGSEV